MKPGIKTTEFWLTLSVSVTAFSVQSAQQLEGPWAFIAIALANAAYAISRGWAKKVGVVVPIIALCLLLTPSCTVAIDPQTLRPSFTLDTQSTGFIAERINEKIIEASK